MSRHNNPLGGLRSSLADAAFAVEERVLWRGGDGMKSVLDVARWPFERAAWALERAVIWPLEERTGEWSGAMRTLGVVGAALLATAVGVLGLVWASIGGGSQSRLQATSAKPAPIAKTPVESRAPAAPVLHGAEPNFKLEASGNSKAGGEPSVAADLETTPSKAGAGESAATASSASAGAVPAAAKVAHRFANAFVLYEIGRTSADVRATFGETATPHLAQKLLQRPPRLPANTKVPRARVLNVVPGPRHGGTYTLSVSLLRLGITSELRLTVGRGADGELRVENVLG